MAERQSNNPGEATGHGLSHEEVDHKVVRGSAWVALSYGGRNVLNLLSMLVLARLLTPSAFGIVALAWTFLFFVYQIQESGVGSALVFRRDAAREAAGAAFYFSVASAFALYAVAFVAAPFAEHAFHAHGATGVFRVMGLVIVLRGFGVVPEAILEREVAFRTTATAELAAAVVQPALAIALAIAGAGVWSLVAGAIAAQAIQTSMMWLLIPWRPKFSRPQFRLLRELLRYGRMVSATNLLVLVNSTIDNIIVGRILGPRVLGFYSVAYRLGSAPSTVIGFIVGRVMFPIYSMLQDDLAGLRRAYLQNLQRVALFALPVSVLFIVVPRPIVLTLLGGKWAAAVGALRILGVFGVVKSFAAPSGEVFRGTGRPQLGLATTAGQICIVIPALIVFTHRWGIEGTAGAVLLAACVVAIVSFTMTLRVLELDILDIGRALAPSGACALGLAAVLVVLTPVMNALAPAAAFAVAVGVGATVYVGATAMLARPIVVSLWTSLRRTPTVGIGA